MGPMCGGAGGVGPCLKGGLEGQGPCLEELGG